MEIWKGAVDWECEGAGKGWGVSSRRACSLGLKDLLSHTEGDQSRELYWSLESRLGAAIAWDWRWNCLMNFLLLIDNLAKESFAIWPLRPYYFLLMSVSFQHPVTFKKFLFFHPNIWPVILYIISYAVSSLGKICFVLLTIPIPLLNTYEN